MSGNLNIFGRPRLNRPNADGVNPLLAEVTRLEMFGPPAITGSGASSFSPAISSASGKLTFVGSSAVTAQPATASGTGSLSFIGASALIATPATTAGTGTIVNPEPEVVGETPSGGGYWNFFVRPFRRLRLVVETVPEPAPVIPPTPIFGRGASTVPAIQAYGFGTVINPKPISGRSALKQDAATSSGSGWVSKGRRDAELELLTLLFDDED